ncbi:hypothetical protein [uncultured Lamprocystis sp.]|jgi:hypothetical protein|uniref:hypothetical protein n=1 Tax=uncultured Lamprocystis sp. TaxID=543132 RepID=UPI0025E160C3|nr:hypothetical protein [uncultured Lamprocystis sp.]
MGSHQNAFRITIQDAQRASVVMEREGQCTGWGGWASVQNGGSCSGNDCDTDGFVRAVNAQGLCGARDWRLPANVELLSIE